MSRRVAIYARVSTEHEAQINALSNQIQYYDNILNAHPDWDLYDRYIDEGITGTSVRKRKNFMRMIKDAEEGHFDLIVTREVSRFARNTADTLIETRKLKKIGVEVYFSEDNIWTFKDEDGELKLTLMATLAQNESKKISQRVKAGQRITFQNGVFYGTGNILGYDKVGKEMIINEEQAKIVRYIYNSYLKGYGTTYIKDHLEKRGYLTPLGSKKWNQSYIIRILKNPFYCGTIVYRKEYVPDYLEQKKVKNKGQVEQIVVEGRHTPIITKRDFEKVQKIIEFHSRHIDTKNKVGGGVPKSIWSEKLICKCGSSFNKRNYHYNSTSGMSYCYQCYRQKNFGSKKARERKGLDTTNSCDSPVVQEWKLEVMSKGLFETIWEERDDILKIAEQKLKDKITEEEKDVDFQNSISEISNKIDMYKNRRSKLLDGYIGEFISKEEYIPKKEELDKIIRKLEEDYNELKNSNGLESRTIEERIETLKEILSKNLYSEERKIEDSVISRIVSKIEVSKEKFSWYLNFENDILDIEVDPKEDKKLLDKVCCEFDGDTSCNQSKKQ